MSACWRWTLGIALTILVVGVPVGFYRWEYTHAKRLREVTPGVLYRSGQMTVSGFREARDRYHIRTIINVQDDYPDPDIAQGYLTSKTLKESELCRRLGVQYVCLAPDLLSRRLSSESRPETIDRFLKIMDDPANYPILIHCKAGLHRTGVMTAVYRMEYQGWSPSEAIQELKAHGFGEFACTSANDYIAQYILNFHRNQRRDRHVGGKHEVESDVKKLGKVNG